MPAGTAGVGHPATVTIGITSIIIRIHEEMAVIAALVGEAMEDSISSTRKLNSTVPTSTDGGADRGGDSGTRTADLARNSTIIHIGNSIMTGTIGTMTEALENVTVITTMAPVTADIQLLNHPHNITAKNMSKNFKEKFRKLADRTREIMVVIAEGRTAGDSISTNRNRE